jgi:hypothetical protein
MIARGIVWVSLACVDAVEGRGLYGSYNATIWTVKEGVDAVCVVVVVVVVVVLIVEIGGAFETYSGYAGTVSRCG